MNTCWAKETSCFRFLANERAQKCQSNLTNWRSSSPHPTLAQMKWPHCVHVNIHWRLCTSWVVLVVRALPPNAAKHISQSLCMCPCLFGYMKKSEWAGVVQGQGERASSSATRRMYITAHHWGRTLIGGGVWGGGRSREEEEEAPPPQVEIQGHCHFHFLFSFLSILIYFLQ